jgi:hypothetical protein
MNTGEHPWTPMKTQGHPWIPMYSAIFGDIRFSHTNVVCKLYVQPLFSQLLIKIYHLWCLAIAIVAPHVYMQV